MRLSGVFKFILFVVSCGGVSCNFFFSAEQNEVCDTPKFQKGTCVPIKQCSELYAILLRPRPLPPDLVEFLRRSQCGFENRQPLVCCPAQAPVTPPTAITTPRTTSAIQTPTTTPQSNISVRDVTRHRNVGLVNPDICGQSSDGRIFGGNKTGIYEYPWMTLLAYRTRKGISFRCGGSLINKQWVLTAAHCISKTKELTLVSVRVGEHDTSTEKDCQNIAGTVVCAPPPQDVNVERTIVHPQYSPTKLINDIALIRLVKPVEMRENVRPICLPVGLSEQTNRLEGLKLIVAGWGATEQGISASPDLLKVFVPVVPVSKCNEVYSTVYKYNIGSNQLCAGGTNLTQDSCSGDSGGPLKRFGEVRGEASMIQYGIVSYGHRNCGTQGVPGVYTRVGHYMTWLLDQLYS